MKSSSDGEPREYRVRTSLGFFLAVFERGRLTGLVLPGKGKRLRRPPVLGGQEGAAGRKLAGQLAAFASGKKVRFTVPLSPRGTAFQRSVWAAMRRIPWGQVRTYGQVARMAGHPGAARAVGGACNANSMIVVNPCHRVVAAGGIGGFGSGLAWKRRLLALEGVSEPR